jgi:homoaconitase/3-isopropylmalate dehydratase large subunit
MLFVVPGSIDKHCSEIIRYYSSWIDHPREANKHFCKENPLAKKIFKSQSVVSSVETYPGKRDVNHEAKCKAWLQKEDKKKDPVIVPKELIVISEHRMKNKTVTAIDPAIPSSSSSAIDQSAVSTARISTREPTKILTATGNGVFHTITLDQGVVPTTVIVEESMDQITVDNYDEATMTQ